MGSTDFPWLRVAAAQAAVVPCRRQGSILHSLVLWFHWRLWFQNTFGTPGETLAAVAGVTR